MKKENNENIEKKELNNLNIRRENFTEFYADMYKKYSDNVAFIYKPDGHTERNNYIEKTFKDYHRDRLILKKFLKDNNCIKEKIAITGRNSYIWSVAFGAIISSDNIVVPLDKDLQVDELQMSIERSEVRILIYDKKYEKIILEATKNIKNLDIHTFDEIQKLFDDNKISLDELIKDEVSEKKSKDDLKMLLFTSGTTALSKMVMLSTDNLLTNIYDVSKDEELYQTDTNISLLPMHHVFGSVGSLYIQNFGVRTSFSDGLRYIAQNLEEYEVSVFIGVPLLIEGIYNKIVKTAKKTGKWGMLKTLIKFSNFLRKMGIDVRRKLFKSVIAGMGGHMRFIVSAAAPLNPKIAEFFNNIGVVIVQGYGLTETSPVLTAETPKRQLLGSSGIPIGQAQIKIDKDSLYNFYTDNLGFSKDDPSVQDIINGREGEILAKGRNVTKGYYKDPEKTKESFTKDGWFKTGDIGYMDGDFLFITGRIKDMIVLSNGKKIFPEEVELLFSNLPGVIESFVFGSDKNLGFGDTGEIKLYVALYYDKKAFKGLSEKLIQQHFSLKVKKINKTLPVYKYIKGVILYDEEFIKTTTKKIKRNIEKNRIEEIYSK